MLDAPLAPLARTCGPRELLRLKGDYLIPCVYHFYKDPPQLVSGHGCVLVDHEGREYLDCFSGVTVMSAGHCNPEITGPAAEQIRTLQHTTSIYLTEPVLRPLRAVVPPRRLGGLDLSPLLALLLLQLVRYTIVYAVTGPPAAL